MTVQHVFLLGAAKSGTTSLAETLGNHSDILLSPAKETTFFQRDREFNEGLEYYRDTYFPDHNDERCLLDAAHRHLYLPWVPERIKSLLPDARFLVILRDPVRRAFSHYWHWRRSGRPHTETLSFEEALHQDLIRIESGRTHRTDEERNRYQQHLTDVMQGLYRTYLDSGYYHEQISRYVERFGRERIKIVFFEEFVDDPQTVVSGILDFLGLSRETPEVRTTNRGFEPRSELFQRLLAGGRSLSEAFGLREFVPDWLVDALRSFNAGDKPSTMNPLTERWLAEHYRPHNKRLEDFLGRSLPAAWNHEYGEGDWQPVRSDVFAESPES